MTPRRVQRKRTKGWRMPPNTVYVGRPTKWGNPYSSAVDLGRYRTFIEQHRADDLPSIRGKNLACWCPLDQPCHADVLLELANP